MHSKRHTFRLIAAQKVWLLLGVFFLLTGCANPLTGTAVKPSSPAITTTPLPSQTPAQTHTPTEMTGTSSPTADQTRTSTIPANLVTIDFFYPFTTVDLMAFNQQLALFNQAHPEIVINVENRFDPTGGDFYATFAGSFDCFVAQNDPQGAARSGQILDLNPLMDGETAAFRQDFDAALLDEAHDQGDLYDLPFTSQPAVMFYNADLLTSLGLKAPSNDWTFTDFVSLIQAATRDTTLGAPASFGFLADGRSLNTIDFLLAGRKVQWLDTSGAFPVANFDTPQMADALTWYAGVSDALALYPSVYWDPYWIFTSGSGMMSPTLPIAFWISLAGTPKGGFPDITFQTGVVTLPQMPSGGQRFQQSYDQGFYISKQSKNPEACWTWIKYLTEHPAAFPGIAARKSLAASPIWEASVGTEAAAVYRVAASRVVRGGTRPLFYNQLTDMDYSLTFDPLYIQGPLRDWEMQALETIYSNSPYDLEQLMAAAQQKMDAYLACVRTVDPRKLTTFELKEKVITCAVQVDPQGHWY